MKESTDQQTVEMAGFSEDQLPAVAQELLAAFPEINVWCFEAEMGVGKTTLIKEICRQSGVGDEMSSPTFSIVNEYLTHSGEEIYHFDFYRMEDPLEAINIGIEDYFFSGKRCLIEWPEIISGFLPEQYLKITIKLVGENLRYLTAEIE